MRSKEDTIIHARGSPSEGAAFNNVRGPLSGAAASTILRQVR